MPEIKQTKQRILGKAVPVYQFIKRVVPSVPSDLLDAEKTHQFRKINNPVVTEGTNECDVNGYSQLCCFFCGKPINENNWLSDSFTENKPCHKKCYDDTKAQIKGAS